MTRPSEASTRATLLVTCADRPGLVAALSQALYSLGLNIVDAAQHTDPVAGQFFQRIRFDTTIEGSQETIEEEALRAAIRAVAARYAMRWTLRFDRDLERVAIFVSKTDHCLYDLLLRHRSGELRCAIPLIVSNHPDLEPIARQFGIAYHVFPIRPENKAEQEKFTLTLVNDEVDACAEKLYGIIRQRAGLDR